MNTGDTAAPDDPKAQLLVAAEFLRNVTTPKYPAVFIWNGKMYDLDKLSKQDKIELQKLFKL